MPEVATSAGTWRARPVFVSSTFKDMHVERTYLLTHVFPRLEEKLRERRHLLEPIDLRFTVEEAKALGYIRLSYTSIEILKEPTFNQQAMLRKIKAIAVARGVAQVVERRDRIAVGAPVVRRRDLQGPGVDQRHLGGGVARHLLRLLGERLERQRQVSRAALHEQFRRLARALGGDAGPGGARAAAGPGRRSRGGG